jgi:CelD/BcsL family acetyltransferase involved in cellulose biosynthesis
MRSEVIPISELEQRDLVAWQRLSATAVSSNPFAEPEFVFPAARAWQVNDLSILVVREGTDWLAALPVRNMRSWRSVPGTCLANWRHDYCYLGAPLVAQGDTEAILATLIKGGLRASGCLALDWIDADGPLSGALASAFAAESRLVVVDEFERPALYRRDSPDYLQQTLSARRLEDYQRKLQLLEQEVGELTLRDASHDPAAYARFIRLERSGWRGEVGSAMACRPGHAVFFTQMCRGFAQSGRLLMLSLASEQSTVAMNCELLAGDMSFNFKLAFDERLARFSPGVQLYIANLDRFHSSGLAWSDSAASDNATLNRLWSGRRRLRSVVATRREPSGVLPYAKWRVASAALPIRRKLVKTVAGGQGH